MSNGKSKLDTGLIRELAAILREADLGELEVEHEGLRVKVTKPAPPAVATYAAPPAAHAPAPAATGTAPAAVAEPAEAVADENAVTAPMVGTVYLSPEPGTKAFVKEGDTVKQGDTLMLVEAMKTFNPVDAPRSGTITKIIVKDAQPVEFGEPLMVIS
ncbi:MAG: acetyl-CoA carboxylase biotin carboxyl carrier protein [Pseudomonadota bacterium]